MTKKVFLDLEETIITCWDDPVLMNVQRLRDLLERLSVKEVDIFSFAVWTDVDVMKFNTDMRMMIETALNVQVRKTWPVSEIKQVVCHKMGGAVFSTSEFCALWGKVRAFPDFIEAQKAKWTLDFVNSDHFILLDDCVPNKSIINKDENIIIDLINIEDLQ